MIFGLYLNVSNVPERITWKKKVNPLLSQQMRHMTPGEGGLFNDRGGEVLRKRMDWEGPQPCQGTHLVLKTPWTLRTKLSMQSPATPVPPACPEGAADDAVTALVLTQTSQTETRQEPSMEKRQGGHLKTPRTGRQGTPVKRVSWISRGFYPKLFWSFQLTNWTGVFISCQ